MDSFELTVEKNYLYYPSTNSYIQLVNLPDNNNIHPFAKAVFWENFKPAYKITVKFQDKTDNYYQFLAFLTNELRRDFVYKETPCQYFERKTDKVKDEFLEKAKEIEKNNQKVIEDLIKLEEKLTTMGITHIDTNKAHLAVNQIKESLVSKHPDYVELLSSCYVHESILLSGPVFEIYCHEKTQIYELFKVGNLTPEILNTCVSMFNNMEFLRTALDAQRFGLKPSIKLL